LAAPTCCRWTTWACARAPSCWTAWRRCRSRASWPRVANAGGPAARSPGSTCGATSTPPRRRASRSSARRTEGAADSAGAGAFGRVPAPVPGLVDDAVPVAARIAEAETELAGAPVQPGEGRGGLEALLGRRFARRAEVQGHAAVVLAVAGRRVHHQDLRQRQSARQLPLENAQLVVVAAIAGTRFQQQAILAGGRAHGQPGAGRRRAQPQGPAEAVVAGEFQPQRFG